MSEAGPSATARMIAAAQLLASAESWQPAPTPEAVAWSRRFLLANGDSVLRRSVDTRVGRGLWRLIEAQLAPGLMHHFLRRKAWIEAHCRERLACGWRQLLILGAGLDSLGLRLQADYRDLRVIELDRAPTATLRARCVGAREGWHAVAGDLVDVAAGGASWQSMVGCLEAQPTIIVCEGVAMYLPFSAVQRLLTRLANHLHEASLIITVMENNRHPIGFRPFRPLSDRWLRLRGEPFRWGITSTAIAPTLAQTGWQVSERTREADLTERWPGPCLSGETLVLAQRSLPGQGTARSQVKA